MGVFELGNTGSDVNELESYGFLQYTILTSPLSIGETIDKNVYASFNGNSPLKANSQLTVSKLTSTTNNFITDEISLFPNPSSGQIFIESESATINNVIINDVSGMVLRKLTNIGTRETAFNLGDFKNGVYFIQLQTTSGLSTYKVLVQ